MQLLRTIFLMVTIALSAAHAAEPSPLPADQAFTVAAERTSDGAVLRWTIAPQTYLYRERLMVREANGAAIPFSTPAGHVKDDPNFGSVEIYREKARARIAAADIPSDTSVIVSFQGCTDSGLCYPPVHRRVDLETLAVSATSGLLPDAIDVARPTVSTDGGTVWLGGSSLAWTILTFLGFGLLLSLTPCVYPMVPILLGILAGADGRPPGWRRGLLLSSVYVLATATAYAVLGVAAAWSGVNLQAALQTPWAIGLMAGVLAVLALGMFGAFELAAPAFGSADSGRPHRRGGIIRAAGLGFGAALVVGPCVTPPLAAALLYIAQSGDLMKGATALFALGLGMGLPLIAVGTFGARLLPRSGAWLLKVRQFFGFVMVGAAIVLVARVVPGQLTLLLWAALSLALGVFLGAFDILRSEDGLPPRMAKAAGLFAVIYGTTLMVGAGVGGSEPLRPLAGLVATSRSEPETPVADVTTIRSPAELRTALAAGSPDKPAFVQVTADWCTICKDIERDVLAAPSVRTALSGFTVIRADVTRDGEGTRALMKELNVVGPPTLIVLEARTGREIPSARITGTTSAAEFIAHLTVTTRPHER